MGLVWVRFQLWLRVRDCQNFILRLKVPVAGRVSTSYKETREKNPLLSFVSAISVHRYRNENKEVG